jgi:hypothetical protein
MSSVSKSGRDEKKCGGAGYRSLCLLHAKQALYHLSYTPMIGCRAWSKKENCANRESNPALKLGKLQCYRYTIGARLQKDTKSRRGGAGFRSPCLLIANQPLYRVSYTPVTGLPEQKVKYKLWGSNPCLFRDWRLKPAP